MTKNLEDVFPLSVESDYGGDFEISAGGKTWLLARENGGGGWFLHRDAALYWVATARVDSVKALCRALTMLREGQQ